MVSIILGKSTENYISSQFGSEGQAQEGAGSGGGGVSRNGVGSREPPEPDVENYVRKATVLARIFISETN